LGAHSKPSRIRVPQAATAAAAAPTLAGVAAAIALSPQTSAQAATLPAPHTAANNAGHTLTVPAAYHRPPSVAQLLAASRASAKQTKNQASTPRSYTVRSGDTLSGIAGKFYHNPAAWPAIYDGNRGKIRWANVISAGEKLTIPAKPKHIPAAPGQLSPRPAYVPRHAAATTEVQAAPVQQPAQTDAYYAGSGSFQQCVISRESGGDPNIWNASGHYGLYQFSYSTWVAYGGSPGSFGHASVAEQNQVFANAMARGGEDNWAPYDGC
jgi:LysM repeat protein